MGEPTISEEVVEALGRYEFMASDCGDRKVLKLTAQEAAEVALTAAEPLMHTAHHAIMRSYQAENARLREALIRAREDMEGWAAYADEYFIEKHDLAGDLAAIDTALAPTTPEPGEEGAR